MITYIKNFGADERMIVLLFHDAKKKLVNIWYANPKDMGIYDQQVRTENYLMAQGFRGVTYKALKTLKDDKSVVCMDEAVQFFYFRIAKNHPKKLKEFYDNYASPMLDRNNEEWNGVKYLGRTDDHFEHMVDYAILRHEYNHKLGVVDVRLRDMHDEGVWKELGNIKVNS